MTSAIARLMSCSNSAFTSPPLLRYAPTGAGSVHTTSMYGGRTIPNRIAHHDKTTSTVGGEHERWRQLAVHHHWRPEQERLVDVEDGRHDARFPHQAQLLRSGGQEHQRGG